MKDCPFCQIIKGTEPASIVYKDEICTAFMDIYPVNPGHLLIVPNKHSKTIDLMDPDDLSHLIKVTQKLYKTMLKTDLKMDGAHILQSNGEACGQEVMHAHFHIIPRFIGDNQKMGFTFDANTKTPERSDLDRVASEIKDKL
jgi:histidine triad (HIT) family protein